MIDRKIAQTLKQFQEEHKMVPSGRQEEVNDREPGDETTFRSMIDMIPVMVWVAEIHRGSTYFNKVWLAFTGRTMEQERGMGWAEGLHPDDYKSTLDAYVRIVRRRKYFKMEFRLRRADGDYRRLISTGVPWYTPAGRFAGYLGSCVDITEIKRSEDSLRTACHDLEQSAQISKALLLLTNMRLRQEIIEHQEAERKLAEQQARLHALASEVSLAEERERRRIAAGLHDEIGQVLATIKLKAGDLLEQESSVRKKDLIKNILTLLDRAAGATRSATFELSSPVLYLLGLEAAVQALGEQMEERHGLRFHFKIGPQAKNYGAPIKIDSQTKNYDLQEVAGGWNESHGVPTKSGPRGTARVEETNIVLYRIVRELLFNVQKHAQARNVTVSIHQAEERLQILVEDDGIGFDAAGIGQGFGPTGGFGLFSVSEQLRGIGGSIAIFSSPGAGTRVVIAAPLR